MPIGRKLIATAFLILLTVAIVGQAREPIRDSTETRKLLFEMDRTWANRAFGTLIREADARLTDLLAAVDDEDEKVQVNAQIILRYLGDSQVDQALNERIKQRETRGLTTALPVIAPASSNMYLGGTDSDPVRAVKNNARLFQASRFNSGHTTVRFIGYNAGRKTDVIELVEGQTFTSGWHIVIRREGDRCRIVTDTNAWVH